MKERFGETTRDLSLCSEIFACRLPYATFQPIAYKDLPYRIRKNIDGEENSGLALEITHTDSTKTYVGENSSFETVYFQDRDKRNKYLGEGQVYVANIEDELYFPVVGFTFTSKKLRRNGFGTRRLFIMDAISRFVFDEPLHSTDSPRISQKSIWEKLVAQEIAEIHQWQGVQRYKFIT